MIKISWQNILRKGQNHFVIAKSKKVRILKQNYKKNSIIISLTEVLIFATENTFFSWIWYLLMTVAPVFAPHSFELNIRRRYCRCSVKIGVFKIFVNFTRKHLCWSLFLIETSGLQLNYKVPQHRCFPVKFVKPLRTPILKNICERLPLKPVQISQGLPFFITYTSGSNWYICFRFCIIIDSLYQNFDDSGIDVFLWIRQNVS